MGSRLQGVSTLEALAIRRSLVLAAGAAALALLPATAAAQFPMPGVHLGGDKAPPSADELARRRALDNAYKSATEKIPEKKSVNDPWGNIRSAPGANGSSKEKGKPQP
jgi:hypothetical protein